MTSLASTEETFTEQLESEMFNTSAQKIIDISTVTGSSDITNTVKAYRLSKEIMQMDEIKIKSSTDDVLKLILKVWNDGESLNGTET